MENVILLVTYVKSGSCTTHISQFVKFHGILSVVGCVIHDLSRSTHRFQWKTTRLFGCWCCSTTVV